MASEWDVPVKWKCPHCKGKVTSWWFSDHYSYGSGYTCENEERYNCSMTLAWEDKMNKLKKVSR